MPDAVTLGSSRLDDPGRATAAWRFSKRFGDVQANSGVDLDLLPGEIHVILGENGAGKSVLAKTLYGIHTPDAGSIRVRGAEVDIDSPARARSLGIGLLFQDFRLAP